eukprot:PhM_4_TR16079/c7_g4_i5/m.94274
MGCPAIVNRASIGIDDEPFRLAGSHVHSEANRECSTLELVKEALEARAIMCEEENIVGVGQGCEPSLCDCTLHAALALRHVGSTLRYQDAVLVIEAAKNFVDDEYEEKGRQRVALQDS